MKKSPSLKKYISIAAKDAKKQPFYRLEHNNFMLEDVHIINKLNFDLKWSDFEQEILNSSKIGVDLEGYGILFSNPFNNMATLFQISTQNNIYLFQLLHLTTEQHSKFLEFFKIILEDKNISKIGVGHHNDINILYKSSKVKPKSRNMIDVQVEFKNTFPEEKKSSLQFMTETVLKKKLSKFEQMCDWNHQGAVNYSSGEGLEHGLRLS